jgi:hypothetical protein
MTLNFQPYQPPPDERQQRLQMLLEGIGGISQGLGNYQKQRQAGLDSQQLRDLQMAKEARETKEFQMNWGSQAPLQRANYNPETGSIAPVTPQAGARPNLIEGFEAYRKQNPRTQQVAAQFGLPQGYTPGLKHFDAYSKIQDSSNPKPVSYQAKEYIDNQGKTRIGKFNPQTGMIEKTSSDEYAPQTARGETAGNLRKEFIDRPEVKDYQLVNTQVKSMDSLFQSAMTGDMRSKNFLDQGLISIFNKINDPGSVIRESEYARTPEGASLVNRLQGSLEKLSAGGTGLTDQDRQDLVIAAKVIANERGNTYQQTRGGYMNLANQMNFDPSLITATMPEFSPYTFENTNQVNAPTAILKKSGSTGEDEMRSIERRKRISELKAKMGRP